MTEHLTAPLREKTWTPTYPDTTGWKQRHSDAIRRPQGPEVPIVGLLDAWIGYAVRHQQRYDSRVGSDYVLGPEWAAIGAALRGLLNGELGRLDGGTLDGILCHNLQAEGFDPEAL